MGRAMGKEYDDVNGKKVRTLLQQGPFLRCPLCDPIPVLPSSYLLADGRRFENNELRPVGRGVRETQERRIEKSRGCRGESTLSESVSERRSGCGCAMTGGRDGASCRGVVAFLRINEEIFV